MTTYPANYPNYDKWGLTQIPTATGATFTPIFDGWGPPAEPPDSDPAVAIVLDWLAVWLVSDGNIDKAWRTIAGAGGNRAVKSIFVHDPNDVDVNTKAFPALYAWRDGGKRHWLADDWQEGIDVIKALWVFPIPTQDNHRKRQPFGHVLAKLIDAGVERGRTPSWVQPGDPDPYAALNGSLFWTFAGFENFQLEDWKKSRLRVLPNERSDTGQIDEYPAIELTFSMAEKVDYGLGRYPVLQGASLTVNSATPVQYTTWAASTIYLTTAAVVPPTANGFFYACTTAGVSGTTAPTFPTASGATVSDGSVVWTCVGPVSVVADAGPLSPT